MKVYVVMWEQEYEGGGISEVLATRQLADAYVSKAESKPENERLYFTIEEWDVQEEEADET